MPKVYTLKQNTDFRTAYYRGTVQVHPCLVVYVRKNRFGTVRIGITTGKKIGKAVQRNRCRRLIREAFRALSPDVKTGYDLVFVARSATLKKSSTALTAVMRELLQKAGTLQ